MIFKLMRLALQLDSLEAKKVEAEEQVQPQLQKLVKILKDTEALMKEKDKEIQRLKSELKAPPLSPSRVSNDSGCKQ